MRRMSITAWNALIRRSRRVEGAEAVDGVAKNEPVVHVSKKGFFLFFQLKIKNPFYVCSDQAAEPDKQRFCLIFIQR